MTVLFYISTSDEMNAQGRWWKWGKVMGITWVLLITKLHPCLKEPCSKVDWVSPELQRKNKQTGMFFQREGK